MTGRKKPGKHWYRLWAKTVGNLSPGAVPAPTDAKSKIGVSQHMADYFTNKPGALQKVRAFSRGRTSLPVDTVDAGTIIENEGFS